MDHKRFEEPSFDSFPDISAATEYKDAPITFTLHDTRGREVEIKLVEPEVDYPLPENDHTLPDQWASIHNKVYGSFHIRKKNSIFVWYFIGKSRSKRIWLESKPSISLKLIIA